MNHRRRPHPSATAKVYDYRSYPKDHSFDGAGSDRESTFYQRPKNQRPINDKYEVPFEEEDRRSSHSSMIPDPAPYYGPYQRFFPDLIAAPSSAAVEDGLLHPMTDDSMFNYADPVSQYDYDHFNGGNFW